MQSMSEEEKQRMMAMMMRSGMSAGMGGEQQQFAPPPESIAAEFEQVSYAPMKDSSRLVTGKGKKRAKAGSDNPNADILETHGMGGDSVGGDGSPSNMPAPSNIPMEDMGNTQEMDLPPELIEAMKKKRFWQ